MSTIDGLTIEEGGGPERCCTGTDTVDGHPVTCAEVALEADFCLPCRESALAARIGELEEALREAVIHHTDQIECWQDVGDAENVAYHRERAGIARAALAGKGKTT